LLLKAVSSERLAAYGRRIKRLSESYGDKCWFIIYQADVHMRSDHMDKSALVELSATPSSPPAHNRMHI